MNFLDELLDGLQAHFKIGGLNISINDMKGTPEYVDWSCKKCLNTIRVPKGLAPPTCPFCMQPYNMP